MIRFLSGFKRTSWNFSSVAFSYRQNPLFSYKYFAPAAHRTLIYFFRLIKTYFAQNRLVDPDFNIPKLEITRSVKNWAKMNLDTKEQFFYIRNKRCKVVANDQCITIQSDLTPNCKFSLDFLICRGLICVKFYWMLSRFNQWCFNDLRMLNQTSNTCRLAHKLNRKFFVKMWLLRVDKAGPWLPFYSSIRNRFWF